ncbi:oligopeptide/dipeptide ABC transporter ATP-binding protein, partial [Orenia marismortui]
KHPYTAGLIKSIPRLDGKSHRLTPIEGNVPDPFSFPEGCKFATRCPFATEECWSKEPQLEDIKDDNHTVRCHRWDEIDLKAE